MSARTSPHFSGPHRPEPAPLQPALSPSPQNPGPNPSLRLTTLLLLCLEKTKVKTALAWQGACYIGFALRKRGRAALLLSLPVSGGGGFVMGPHKRGRGKYTGKCMRQIKISGGERQDSEDGGGVASWGGGGGFGSAFVPRTRIAERGFGVPRRSFFSATRSAFFLRRPLSRWSEVL